MMIQGAPVVLGGKKKSNVPAFVYTGKYNVRDDDVVELLESGEITFVEDGVIDVFMVGGGGGGTSVDRQPYSNYQAAGGGGGGGYTRTLRRISVPANTQIPVTVGAGGQSGASGGATAFNTDYAVNGGLSKGLYTAQGAFPGADGGSGGGGGTRSNSDGGTGGSDGGNGESGYPTSVLGGNGQGFTTREFGEATGKLYAGGGGGGRFMESETPIISIGGSGGGGSGAWISWNPAKSQAPAAGTANTGGGGGGGAATNTYDTTVVSQHGALGGSGIVCFRDAQELPELAGTWVLNNRLYAPESDVYFNNQDFKIGDASNPNRGTGRNLSCTTTKIWYTSYPSGYDVTVYTFSSNSWGSDKLNYFTFPAGATASDEFRAWLASNATKQS